MSTRKLLAAALVTAGILGLPAWSGPAVAADLDGPFYGDAPPPVAEQKVEFGSGWYIRGDIGVTEKYDVLADTIVDPYGNTLIGNSIDHTHEAGYGLSIGGGYALTNGFRGDITADFHQPATSELYDQPCYGGATQSCITTGKFKSYDALANVYYEFGRWGIVSPYVGAGVGVGFGELSGTLLGGSTTYGTAFGYHNLAWALMAGVAIDIYDHTKLDVGYRYLDNGSVAGTHLYYNEIRAGIRYMIDN